MYEDRKSMVIFPILSYFLCAYIKPSLFNLHNCWSAPLWDFKNRTEKKNIRSDSFHNCNGMQWFTACACATLLIKCMWPFKLDCLLSPLIHSNCIINGVCIHSFIQWCIQNLLLPRYDNWDISLWQECWRPDLFCGIDEIRVNIKGSKLEGSLLDKAKSKY